MIWLSSAGMFKLRRGAQTGIGGLSELPTAARS